MKTRKAHLSLVLAMFLFGMRTANGALLGTEAHYRFDGNSNDSSGNGNHGLNIGGVFVSDRFGNPASAIHFSGPLDRVDLPSGLFAGNEGSVSFWLKSDTIITGVTGQGSIYPFWVFGTRPGDSNPTPGEDLLSVFFGDGTLVMDGEMFGVMGGDGIHPRAANSSGEFGYLDTAWHHVALTSDPLGFHLYFDGVEWVPTMFTDGLTPSSNLWPIVNELDVKIGGNDSSDNIPKPFAIDGFRIGNRAWTEEEVLGLFHEPAQEAVPESSAYATLGFMVLVIAVALRSAKKSEDVPTKSVQNLVALSQAR